MKFVIMQLVENKLQNWSLAIFHSTCGQLVYWSEQANLKESARDNHIVSIRSLNCYFFTKCISLFAND